MNYKKSVAALVIFSVFIGLFSFTFFKGAKKNIEPAINWIGKRMVFSEELKLLKNNNIYSLDCFIKSSKNKNKIISIIDASCSRCILGQLNKIDSLFAGILKEDYNAELVFILNVDDRDFKSFMVALYPLITSNAPILCDNKFRFETSNNIFTSDLSKRTFLVNKKNEIILVGNPLYSTDLLIEYKNKIMALGN